MSRLDDRLTQELEQIAHPADPTPAFERVDRRRSRLHVRRRIRSAGLVAVVVLGSIGGFVFLSDAFRDGATEVGGSLSPTPSATTTTAPGPVDLGLGFPVCDVLSMHADFDGNGASDTASIATKMSDVGGCPAPGTSTQVLAVDLDGDGKADAVGGPLACPGGCEPFATPDVDADGLAEIAIVVDRLDDGTTRIQLWDLTTPPGGSLAVIPFVDGNGDPATFTWGTVENWGGTGPEVFGVSCTSRTSPPLVTEWQAIPTSPDSWHISEHGYHVVGTKLRSSFEDSYDVPGEETVFPDGGGDTICGAPVYATTSADTAQVSPRLGFPVCNVSSVAGTFGSAGVQGKAYVATKMGDTTGCPPVDNGFNVIAIDLDGDGVADTDLGPIECELECRAFSAPDLNGDGISELLVVQRGGTELALGLYMMQANFGPNGIGPIAVSVAPPGDPDHGFRPGRLALLLTGGDAGNAERLYCDTEGHTFGQTLGSMVPFDSPDAVWKAHDVTFTLGTDGMLRVVDTSDYDAPLTSPPFDGPGPTVEVSPEFPCERS